MSLMHWEEIIENPHRYIGRRLEMHEGQAVNRGVIAEIIAGENEHRGKVLLNCHNCQHLNGDSKWKDLPIRMPVVADTAWELRFFGTHLHFEIPNSGYGNILLKEEFPEIP